MVQCVMSRPAKSRSSYQRPARVGEEIRHALVEIIRRTQFHEPVLADLSITVSEVRVSTDLRSATVYVIPLGGKELEEVVAAMQRVSSRVRAALTKAVYLRSIPTLHFKADYSFQRAERVDDLLRCPLVQRDLLASSGQASQRR